jgi:NADH/NAD ratio-sensing transcriptional regulator Rex
MIIIGAGHLGQALGNYGFDKNGFKVVGRLTSIRICRDPRSVM